MAPPCPTTHKLLDRIEDLRVFPEVGARVLAVAHSPRTTLSDMERAVSADPVLAGKVVELSNSALYLRGRPHDELRRAIQVLGFAATRDTALALALASIGDPADASTAYLWRHATAAARVAQALAPFVPVAVARSAHLCALVHDIGRQLMAVVHPGALDEVLEAEWAGHPDVLGLERQRFGVDHAALGAACLDRWSFRPEVARAVALHHLPVGSIVEADDRQRVALLQLADAVVRGMLTSDRVEGVMLAAASEPARRVLGVPKVELARVVTQLLADEDEARAAA